MTGLVTVGEKAKPHTYVKHNHFNQKLTYECILTNASYDFDQNFDHKLQSQALLILPFWTRGQRASKVEG